jgi:hypothetical protein
VCQPVKVQVPESQSPGPGGHCESEWFFGDSDPSLPPGLPLCPCWPRPTWQLEPARARSAALRVSLRPGRAARLSLVQVGNFGSCVCQDSESSPSPSSTAEPDSESVSPTVTQSLAPLAGLGGHSGCASQWFFGDSILPPHQRQSCL